MRREYELNRFQRALRKEGSVSFPAQIRENLYRLFIIDGAASVDKSLSFTLQ